MKYSFLAAALLPVFLVACGDSNDGEKGSFTLGVTDAPVDTADHVWIRFTDVTVHSGEQGTKTFTFDEPKNIDLLNLTGSNSANLLENVQLDAGSYQWIRLGLQAEDGVKDSYIVLTDGSENELVMKSTTGLKLNRGFTVAAGGNNSFTIDFDLRKSITEANGEYKLRPTLRIVDNLQVGHISGSVDSTLISGQCGGGYAADTASNHGAVYVYEGADIVPAEMGTASGVEPLTTAFVNYADGAYSYEAGFLETGSYTLAYTCNNADDLAESEEGTITFTGEANVSVAANETATHNFTGAPAVTGTEGGTDAAN